MREYNGLAGCLANFPARVIDDLIYLVGLLFFCFGNKVSSTSTSETRQIEVGVTEEGSKKKHNKIKTSKYTLLMFIPKNLTEQFRRVVNFYFLIVTVIAIVIDSPVSPFTSIAPLSFMVLVTAVKQGYEDWLRHKTDNKINNQLVEIVHKGVIKEVRNSSIAPGTLVRVKRGREVPADLVLLCSAGELGKCYITTANLDGETNLKTLRVPPPLVAYTPDVLPQHMRIEVPHPVADLYTFYGRLEIPSIDSLVLGPDNLMLRGSRVKNTEWAIGCAVYTGEETKLALNSKYSGNKFSSCELAVNSFLLFFILLLVGSMVVSLGAKMLIERRNPAMDLYLGPGTPYPAPFSYLTQDFFSFLLLYYYIIPMSLYVTIELYKFIGSLFIGWDEELCCEETGRPAIANTSDLNEELGQVEVLFSDKTGTLTKNLMVFKSCSISGTLYEERENALFDVSRFDQPVNIIQTDVKFFFTILALCHSVQISNEEMKKRSARLSTAGNLMNLFRRKKAKAQSNGIEPSSGQRGLVNGQRGLVNGQRGLVNGQRGLVNGQRDLIDGQRDLVNGIDPVSANNNNNNAVIDNMALNTILNCNGSKMDYQASSPDEKALVEAADRFGVTFLGEEGNNLLIRVGEHTEMYERMQFIEFTSERKRMSVIVRDKDGKILLFCKGAESSVFPLCKNSPMIEDTNRDIDIFANKGLRTLAIAFRVIPDEEYEAVAETIKKLDGKSAEELQLVTQQYRVLERQLTLVGATAVEDCLQDDVADTLASLRRAGIKTWVLTGDKVETAINVAQSCAHISENDKRMFILGVEDRFAVEAHLNECRRIIAEPGYRDLTLVVDGTSMGEILDTKYAGAFGEISLRCSAVLCCRLSPIQKAKIVKLIKESPSRPITAAIGDGANDISMIQEAHVGFGIFGKEGYQAARSADFAFTKFSMVKKVLLVMGHWYYQRLATLIHYFFYKNLVLGILMFAFQIQSAFSTQSIFDSAYLTLFNMVFSSLPCLILSVTEQRWPKEVLMKNPILYRDITRNKLMSWPHFLAWLASSLYHSVIIFIFAALTIDYSVVSLDGKPIDLWCYGAILFHMLILIINLKIWMHARYHTGVFVASVLFSIFIYILFNAVYSLIRFQYDGDVLGTYTRLLASPAFWFLNLLIVVATLAPDIIFRLIFDKWGAKLRQALPNRTVFSTRL